MEINQRVKVFIDHLGMNENQFAAALGMDRADKIYNITGLKNLASTPVLELISKKFVSLNMNWVLRGTGNMLLDEEEVDYSSKVKELETENKRYKGSLDLALQKVEEMEVKYGLK